MNKRLKIYFVHSDKIDYNNLIYKEVLSNPICLKHDLILPLTKKYQTRYVKELINEADIIIADVSNTTFTHKYELSLLKKSGKPVKYISLDNEIPKKLNKVVSEIELTTLEKPYIKIIENFILSKEEESNYNALVLGDI